MAISHVSNYCPDDAKPSGSVYYGIGPATLPTDIYTLQVDSLMVIFGVTRKNCVPVGEVIYGTLPDGGKFKGLSLTFL